jgi:hypothetical protein
MWIVSTATPEISGDGEQNEAYRAALEAKLSSLTLQDLSGNSRDGERAGGQ